MASDQPSPDGPLSLQRLTRAFETLFGHAAGEESPGASQPEEESTEDVLDESADSPVDSSVDDSQPSESCEINTRSVVEALLFVGHPENRPITAREMAAMMRGVSPAEIDSAVAELNAIYQQEAAPYEITTQAAGYRLSLQDGFGRMRDKFSGKLREAKLTPAVVEVLSVVAYNQPATVDQVNTLRGKPSGAALATLVRRKLVRLDRPSDQNTPPHYATTDRFLRLFGLENIEALPRSEELEEA